MCYLYVHEEYIATSNIENIESMEECDVNDLNNGYE